MANNFQTRIKNNSNNMVSISVFGDFDGTSACELADVVKGEMENARRINIHTDGLRDVDHFGLSVFLARVKKFRKSLIKLEFMGRHKDSFKD